MVTLQDILQTKGRVVHTIEPSATLLAVAEKLYENHCGSLLVCERRTSGGSQVVGIITERDLLRAAATNGGNIAALRVEPFMSTALQVGSPHDTIDDVMHIMTSQRIRHLPVMDGDQLIGLISIGDLVKAHQHEVVVENYYLKAYIQS